MYQKISKDNKAYVESSSELRKFRVVVENVEFFDNQTGLNHVKVDFDKKNCMVELSFTVDINQETAKEQMMEFNKLLWQLNSKSFVNQFYLDRVDFFQRQCKNFVESLVSNLSNERKNTLKNPQENSYNPGNYAF